MILHAFKVFPTLSEAFNYLLVGLKLGHPLPVIAKINLNTTPTYEPVEAL